MDAAQSKQMIFDKQISKIKECIEEYKKTKSMFTEKQTIIDQLNHKIKFEMVDPKNMEPTPEMKEKEERLVQLET